MSALARTAVGLLATALAAAPPAAAETRGTADDAFADTTEVVVVEVPVHVVRDGQPVTGLTADDFVVEDEGRRQEIVGFEVVDLYGAAGDATAEPTIAARRHFLFLFDLGFSPPEAVVRARDAAVAMLGELHESDLAAVATVSPTQGAAMVLGFTPDRQQVALAIRSLGVTQLIDRSPDPLNLVLGSATGAPAGDGPGGAGRAGEVGDEYAEHLQAILTKLSVAERADQQSRVGAFSRNVQGIARTLAAVDGRKHVVLFSQGIADDLLIGTGGDDVDSRRARESGEIWNVSMEDMFGSSRAQNDLQEMVTALRRADAVVQAVDIGRLRAAGAVEGATAAGRSSLFTLAHDTGGELIENSNDLGGAAQQMLRKTGVTYLLAFAPDRVAADGAFHRLEVKLRDGRRGGRVLHRAGYTAPRPFAERDAAEKRVTAAELVVAREDSGSVDLDVLVAPQPSAGPRHYVPVLVEIGGATLLARDAGPTADVELFVYAFDEAGGVADHLVQVTALDLARVGEALRRQGLKHWGHLDLAPGRYRVRVVARNLETGEHGARTAIVHVPDFGGGAPYLLPPLVPEPPDRWVLTREGPERHRDVPYPFMLRGAPFLPAARAVLPRDATAHVVLQGFALGGDADGEWTVRLLDAGGAPIDGVRGEAVVAETTAGVTTAEATLPTAGLAPGLYQLEVRADGRGAVLPAVVR